MKFIIQKLDHQFHYHNIIRLTLYTLRYKKIASLWNYLSILLVRIFGPKLAAFLTYLTIDWGDKECNPTVLCLFRESFIKDIHEMRKRSSMGFVVVMGGFTRFQAPYFPEGMRIQSFYQIYQGPGRSRALNFSRKYSIYLLRYIKNKRNIEAVISANFDYWQEVGLKQVCIEKNIPFLVLSKEHPIVPSACNNFIDRYVRSAYTFEGDLIAVAGESTKKVLSRIGTVFPDERVVITGLPRFDAWRDVNLPPIYQRDLVTLLTFTRGYSADEGFIEILQLFLKAAEKNHKTGLKFLIKTKDAFDHKLVTSLVSESQKKLVKFSYEDDLSKVLPNSRCVVGYNSLSQLEAAIARCQLISPAWGECKARGDSVMYSVDDPVVAEIIDFAFSPSEMLEMIDQAAAGCRYNQAPSHDSIEKFVKKYVYIHKDKTSSEAVVSCIRDAINRRGYF